ncbi:MAG TPA: biotin--[acetyl-CoA-carboxylase] ligase [Bacillota bacterium]|nr:biotin--[acetyl-CoA-carboxylase] ligase [Bacillota bacterium]
MDKIKDEVGVLKKAILRLLKSRQLEYVSGEEICRSLDVTRTAVWKHIQVLREEGYGIEARSRLGYMLTSIPDRLYPVEILDGLSTRFIGRKVFYCDSVSSTNDLAKELVRKGAEEGSLVIAEEQTSGRGRLGRKWYSPKYKSILFTLVLRPPTSPSEAARITLIMAVALVSAIKKVTGVVAGIKWPNDLLVNGKKICGILSEMSAEMDQINYLEISAGINVNQGREDFPADVRNTATSLRIEASKSFPRVRLLQASLEEFERWYGIWLSDGFGPLLEKFKEYSISLHCPVTIHTLNRSWDGWAEDIDEDGALLLRLPDGGLQRFISGDVSLRLA